MARARYRSPLARAFNNFEETQVDDQKNPEKASSKFFYLTANNTFVFGLDHDGYVWSRLACEVESKWRCLGRPEIEGELKAL